MNTKLERGDSSFVRMTNSKEPMTNSAEPMTETFCHECTNFKITIRAFVAAISYKKNRSIRRFFYFTKAIQDFPAASPLAGVPTIHCTDLLMH
ncbi:hypothetical protein SAMN05421876_105256 [Kaistella jeonii]|nr:hypothetical protein SAMN05421876_105256 [Kaistella jeonii]VEI96782.1 Uncharacterised protein [Kaistella jeonii]